MRQNKNLIRDDGHASSLADKHIRTRCACRRRNGTVARLACEPFAKTLLPQSGNGEPVDHLGVIATEIEDLNDLGRRFDVDRAFAEQLGMGRTGALDHVAGQTWGNPDPDEADIKL